jgi:UDP-glucose/GDP-mannose dehydrogenase family, central domain
MCPYHPAPRGPGFFLHARKVAPSSRSGAAEPCHLSRRAAPNGTPGFGSPAAAARHTLNIALVSELAMLTDRMHIDIWEVLDAASTKPYGFMRLQPGPGMGGHCLPVDPFYLSWRAREFDMTTEFIELAGKINQQMPYHCVAKVERALNQAGRTFASSVSAGKENKATGEGSSISGGGGGEASGAVSSVTGGRLGKAPYFASTVLGGLEEVTEAEFGVTP